MRTPNDGIGLSFSLSLTTTAMSSGPHPLLPTDQHWVSLSSRVAPGFFLKMAKKTKAIGPSPLEKVRPCWTLQIIHPSSRRENTTSLNMADTRPYEEEEEVVEEQEQEHDQSGGPKGSIVRPRPDGPLRGSQSNPTNQTGSPVGLPLRVVSPIRSVEGRGDHRRPRRNSVL
ncbi:hypothetical protein CH63R_07553 [Colletotrichum higginsianum IMI 349063]|uniref:Uncharacterized protein n=1 Tax=Colletotrichum higginsianum (strain IMI 349063) TaxID=759273 RepID=A0A1B7YA91_COLHI|nr:hypothetical protein CH63R_07553 [Colletotrichum higginsianum IMI 349063]OBR08788.1 hypothetical protein CH63R_07553 [Colletotrichum higginsianum IMI 349063]